MEWQQIVGFYQVARLRSFTRAAEATFRTQSALTQQVKALEREFDCQLLERIGKRRVLLTPAGEKFFQFAASLLRDADRLRADIDEHRNPARGRLCVAAPFTTLYHLLAPIAGRYLKRLPWVELTLLDRPQREVGELVRAGESDIGLVTERMAPSDLVRHRWRRIEPVLLLPRGHQLERCTKPTLADIARYPLVLPPRSSASPHRSRLESLFAKQGLRYRVVMESSNIELSSRYVELGLGISFASIVPGIPALKRRKLSCRPLGSLFDSEYLCVITRKEKRPRPHQEEFLALLSRG